MRTSYATARVLSIRSDLPHRRALAWYKDAMDDAALLERIRALRAEGRSPKAIARTLGLRPAHAAALVRAAAQEHAKPPADPTLGGCWVSPGWSAGLAVPADRGWPDRDGCGSDTAGLAGVLVARASRRGGLSVCGYLVDTYCLGVKDALGPREMSRSELRWFRGEFFGGFDGEPVEAPIDLARELVWGGAAYARELGFKPHPDFRRAAGHLEPLEEPSAIGLGRYGKPFYMQGPFDDGERVMRTLRRHVGDDFTFLVEGDPQLLAAAPR